jgi:tetratricopeptide (TPR) repeat protein
VLAWHGRLQFYEGHDEKARMTLKHALDLDPNDSDEIKIAIRRIRQSKELKVEASEHFNAGRISQAIDTFTKCLALDEYNIRYNSTIHLNIALGKSLLYVSNFI